METTETAASEIRDRILRDPSHAAILEAVVEAAQQAVPIPIGSRPFTPMVEEPDIVVLLFQWLDLAGDEGLHHAILRVGFETTVQQADWVSVMCFYDGTENKATTFEAGAKGLGTFLFPASEAVVLDTWTADGLIATGTHKVMAKDVFVPDHRMLPFTMGTPTWIAASPTPLVPPCTSKVSPSARRPSQTTLFHAVKKTSGKAAA